MLQLFFVIVLIPLVFAQKYANQTGNPSAFSPSYYPSLLGGKVYDPSWETAYAYARNFVSGLTLAEKINITTGSGWEMGLCVGTTNAIPRLGFNGLCLEDGPLGVRKSDFISAFPAGITAGSTFNKNLMYWRGAAIGSEHRAKGVDIMLGPVVGPLGLKAAGGRNWEGFGADPYLAGIASAQTVQGIQDQGIMANAKHWIGYEQEHFRQVGESVGRGYNITASISSNIDDRTLHEIYAWPFANMIRAGVASLMCSYNQVNNSYACQNSYILNKILKEELGFQGFVMSDWGATQSGVASALAGLDMDMPGSMLEAPQENVPTAYFGPNLTVAVLNGTVPISRLDDMATRVMAGYFKVGLNNTRMQVPGGPNFDAFDYNNYGPLYIQAPNSPNAELNQHVDARSSLSYYITREVATEAVVLVKNVNNSLPLTIPGTKSLPRRISLFGVAAGPDPNGPNCQDDIGCSGGALGSGWGSGAVNFPWLVTPYEAISNRAIKAKSIVNTYFQPGDISALDTAVNAATYSDLNIIFGLTDSGEGYIEVDGNAGDRKNTTLWHDIEPTILQVAALNTNNVVVISTVGPVNVENWIDHPNITAVVMTTPGGQDAGEAIARILFGEVNPSGRLPFTVAKNDTQYVPIISNAQNGTVPQDNFPTGLTFDYRYFDVNNIEPRFAFGYGLSFSNWTISNISVSNVYPVSTTPPAPPPYNDLQPTDEGLPSPESLLYPNDLTVIDYYVYPYIESVGRATPNGTYPYPPGYSTTQPTAPPSAGGGSGGNPALWDVLYQVQLSVSNNGPYGGAYVPQIYLGLPQNSQFPTPPKQLRGFEKVSVQPGQSTVVNFDLLRRDLSVWDTESQNWLILSGEYSVYGCHNSRDCPVIATFTI
jgi:beta-glucosidase-like glycosyl hydrolase